MMLGSIARGGIVAAFIATALALPRAFDLSTVVWIGLLVALHLALPVAAAFWGRRSDVATLDIGLAGVGAVYMGLLALMSPQENAVVLYLGVPLGYAAYAFVATMIFTAGAKWRRLVRVRGLRQLRAEVRSRMASST
jgi:hypothetical protein